MHLFLDPRGQDEDGRHEDDILRGQYVRRQIAQNVFRDACARQREIIRDDQEQYVYGVDEVEREEGQQQRAVAQVEHVQQPR